MSPEALKLIYDISKKIAKQRLPDELIFFEKIWYELEPHFRERLPGDIASTELTMEITDFHGPGMLLTPSALLMYSVAQCVESGVRYAIANGELPDKKEFQELVRRAIREKHNVPDELLSSLPEVAEQLLFAELSLIDLKELKLAGKGHKTKFTKPDESSGLIKLGFNQEDSGYINSGTGNKSIHTHLFPILLVLAAARKYIAGGCVKKFDELRLSKGAQEISDLRQDLLFCLTLDMKPTEIIKAYGKKTGKVYLNIAPEKIEIDASVLEYEHPERGDREERINLIYSAWVIKKKYYKEELGNPVPPEKIREIFTRAGKGGDLCDFGKKLDSMEKCYYLVQYAVEKIMKKPFHSEKWLKDWEVLIQRKQTVAGLIEMLDSKYDEERWYHSK